MVQGQEGGGVDPEPGGVQWSCLGHVALHRNHSRGCCGGAVRKGDFIISIKARGEIRSTHSATIVAPQVPDPRIVKLAEAGNR